MLHFVAFGAMVGTTVVDILIGEKEEEQEKPPPPEPQPRDEPVIVELDAEALLAMRDAAIADLLPPETVAIPEPTLLPVLPEPALVDIAPIQLQPEGYQKTSEAQESEVAPDNAVLIGERNTIAASEQPGGEEGLALPTQEGEKPRRDERHLFNSEFSPGEEEGNPSKEAVKEETLAGDPNAATEETKIPVEASQPVEEQGVPKEELLTSDNVIEVPMKEGKQEEKEETLPKESEKEREPEVAKQGEGGDADRRIKEKVEDGGFRTEAKKTRVEGTISRRGRSALDVESTAIGKYKARVNRVIETEWQRLCVVHRDHLLPGILTLRFYLDKNGRVSGIRYLDVFHASEMQKGFTMQAVKQPKLPAMPKEVRKELEGEPLEFRINFNF